MTHRADTLAPPDHGRSGRRARRILNRVGAVLLGLGSLMMLMPVVDDQGEYFCGETPSVIVAVFGASASGPGGACRSEGIAQTEASAMLFVVPGLLILLRARLRAMWTAARRAWRDRTAPDHRWDTTRSCGTLRFRRQFSIAKPGWFFAVGVIGLAGSSTDPGYSEDPVLVTMFAAVVLITGPWLVRACRVRVHVTDERLVIHSWGWTHRLPMREIAGVHAVWTGVDTMAFGRSSKNSMMSLLASMTSSTSSLSRHPRR